MDKTNLLERGAPCLSEWLEAWWQKECATPKIGLVMESGPSSRGHSYTYIEWPRLIICLKGTRSYRLGFAGEQAGQITAGQALYFAPGVWLSPLPVKHFRSLGVHWEPERIQFILREGTPLAPPKEVWTLPSSSGGERRLAEQVGKLAAHSSGRYAAEALLLLEVGLLIERLQAVATPRPGRRHALYLRVCAFLEEHSSYAHTRENVAARFGISAGHLTRLFREEGGMGFNAFLNTLRLRKAGMLLSSTALSVGQIALQCGFADPAYFSRLFRKRYGVSPGRVEQRNHVQSSFVT